VFPFPVGNSGRFRFIRFSAILHFFLPKNHAHFTGFLPIFLADPLKSIGITTFESMLNFAGFLWITAKFSVDNFWWLAQELSTIRQVIHNSQEVKDKLLFLLRFSASLLFLSILHSI